MGDIVRSAALLTTTHSLYAPPLQVVPPLAMAVGPRVMSTLVTLHVYDVTNSSSATANSAVININKLFKDSMGLGGVFHCGVEVNREEWSFGYCDYGTGVYSCRPKCNSMYTFRESIPIGVTSMSPYRLRQTIATLQLEWPGSSYDLFSRNCNHFCEALAEALGVGPVPAWVNSLPNFADGIADATSSATAPVRMLGDQVSEASASVSTWFSGLFVTTDEDEEESSKSKSSSSTAAQPVST